MRTRAGADTLHRVLESADEFVAQSAVSLVVPLRSRFDLASHFLVIAVGLRRRWHPDAKKLDPRSRAFLRSPQGGGPRHWAKLTATLLTEHLD